MSTRHFAIAQGCACKGTVDGSAFEFDFCPLHESAAALLEALEGLMGEPGVEEWNQARAAIKSAKGED